jgi:hypothetical protein
MSFILTLTSNSTSSLTSTTSSAIGLTQILTGAAVATGVLIFVLILNGASMLIDARNANTTAALWAICVPLLVIFCAFVVFKAARAFG